MIHIINASYISSFPSYDTLPSHNLFECCFIGKSNVGKSTLINTLCHQKKLAKTSQEPGKTQLLNLFKIDFKTTKTKEFFYMVDLPGLGYAKLSKKQRGVMTKMVFDYLEKRNHLKYIFYLADARHVPLEDDLNILRFLIENNTEFGIILTKADKLKPAQLDLSLTQYKNILKTHLPYIPKIIYTGLKMPSQYLAILSEIETRLHE
ncbi:MAG: ribosome biogenesis GTP-binding protein YihA/YsxC [Alphaproteobacteria bacterium]|nr:ribosome biogenesis GTP-binding protein YihA/YsxC [Alphaproteobacteria bacterium]